MRYVAGRTRPVPRLSTYLRPKRCVPLFHFWLGFCCLGGGALLFGITPSCSCGSCCPMLQGRIHSPRRTVGVDMVVALAQHHGSDLSLELGGKRTSLLAHQTPLSRRGFLPKSVSGISGPLQAPPLFRSVKYKHQ